MNRLLWMPIWLACVCAGWSQPQLWVFPGSLEAETSAGGIAAPAELRVANTGAGDMSYTVSFVTLDGEDWLGVSPLSGTSSGETDLLAVSYASSSLDVGVYTGVVTVTASGAIGSPVDVPVYLRINRDPVPAWDVGDLETPLGGSVRLGEAMPDNFFHVWNAGDEPRARMRYEVRLSDDLRVWVDSVTPETGTSRDQIRKLTVKYATENLERGVYGGQLTVMGVNLDNGEYIGSLTTNLSLSVMSHTAVAASESSLSATILENLAKTNMMMVWNAGDLPRRPMQYRISADKSWLSFVPDEGVLTDGTATVHVIFSGGNMAPGSYSATMRVDAWDAADEARASGSPMRIPVSMVVESRTPVNYEPPEVRGSIYLGRTVSAWPGIWNRMGRLRFEYAWERADTPDGGGRMLARSWSSDASYHVRASDRGKFLRVVVRAVDDDPVQRSTQAASSFRTGRFRAVPGDLDGDGISDLWFFDTTDGVWRAALSSGVSGSVRFGESHMVPVPGDFSGNGYMDLALYDPHNGMWHVLFLPQWQYAYGHFGGPGMQPVPGDYNGDGSTDLGLYIEQTGDWYIYYINEWHMRRFNLGGPGMQPVPGDYDGDGIADLAVYNRRSGLWRGIGSRNGALWEASLGGTGAEPAPADYDGDGKLDLAVYWPASNRWLMRASSDGVLHEKRFGVSYGAAVPRPGYYDHDIFCDPAHAQLVGDFIIWCVRRSTETDYFNYRGQSYQVSTDQWRVNW